MTLSGGKYNGFLVTNRSQALLLRFTHCVSGTTMSPTREAKKANRQRNEIFMYVPGTACRQHDTNISYREAVLQLQLQTSELSKAAHVGSSRGPHLEKFVCMAIQKEKLGMMVHDSCIFCHLHDMTARK